MPDRHVPICGCAASGDREVCGGEERAMAATRGGVAAVPASSKTPRVAGICPSTSRPHRGVFSWLVQAVFGFNSVDPNRDLEEDLLTSQV